MNTRKDRAISLPYDIGRPIGHILSNLVGYDRLVTDTLIPRELEVQTTTGVWYALRIHPYRTLENVIEGAVIVRDAHDAITMRLNTCERIPVERRADDLARLPPRRSVNKLKTVLQPTFN